MLFKVTVITYSKTLAAIQRCTTHLSYTSSISCGLYSLASPLQCTVVCLFILLRLAPAHHPALLVLSIRAFMRRRLEFNQFLSSNKSLTLSRYFRLMALATTEILCTTPLATFTICLNILSSPMSPYRSWSDTHLDYSRVVRYPRLLWHSDHLVAVSMDMTRWVTVASALMFFVYFGFASEARRHYKLVYERAFKLYGIKFPTKQDKKTLSVKT